MASCGLPILRPKASLLEGKGQPKGNQPPGVLHLEPHPGVLFLWDPKKWCSFFHPEQRGYGIRVPKGSLKAMARASLFKGSLPQGGRVAMLPKTADLVVVSPQARGIEGKCQLARPRGRLRVGYCWVVAVFDLWPTP